MWQHCLLKYTLDLLSLTSRICQNTGYNQQIGTLCQRHAWFSNLCKVNPCKGGTHVQKQNWAQQRQTEHNDVLTQARYMSYIHPVTQNIGFLNLRMSIVFTGFTLLSVILTVFNIHSCLTTESYQIRIPETASYKKLMVVNLGVLDTKSIEKQRRFTDV